jgi:hypothetical protein
MSEEESAASLERRIKQQFPSLFITLLSVLIGIVMADLITEVRVRLVLWPLNIDTLRTWGQVLAHGQSAVTVWIIFSHLGVSHERVPGLADSIVSFLVPLTLLFAMPLIGVKEIWPWLYFGSGSLVVCLATSWWLLRLSRDEPGFAGLNRRLHRNGYFSIFYVGIPMYALAGLLGEWGMLSPIAELALAVLPTPAAMLAAYLFVREWRVSIEEISTS